MHAALVLFALLPVFATGTPVFNFGTGVRLALNQAPSSVAQACAEGRTHNVEAVSQLANGIKITSGTCTPTNATARRELEQRAVASSPLPDGRAPGDECDTPCASVCFPGSTGPVVSDCQFMLNNLFARPDQDFTLGLDGFVLFTFQTCGTSIANQIAGSSPTPMTYCYRDWAGVGHFLANHCQGDTGAGGKCVAKFGSFEDVPDWYIQVYTNHASSASASASQATVEGTSLGAAPTAA